MNRRSVEPDSLPIRTLILLCVLVLAASPLFAQVLPSDPVPSALIDALIIVALVLGGLLALFLVAALTGLVWFGWLFFLSICRGDYAIVWKGKEL